MRSVARGLGFGVWGLFCAALLQGCGDTSDGIPIDQLSTDLAAAVCDNIGGCCEAAAIPFDLASCKAKARAVLDPEVAEELTRNVSYDAVAAEHCLGVYGQVVRSCDLLDHRTEEACRYVFVGQLPTGAVCSRGEECAPTAGGTPYCKFGDDPEQGLCAVRVPAMKVARPHGKSGDLCGFGCDSGGNCSGSAPASVNTDITTGCYVSDGLYCGGSGFTCQPLVANGQPCLQYDACQTGSFCGAGVCEPKLADGAACTGSSECNSESCLFNPQSAVGVCASRNYANAKTCAGDLN